MNTGSEVYILNYRKGVPNEMKITIENVPIGSEPEIIIRCNELDESLLQLIYSIKSTHKFWYNVPIVKLSNIDN